MGITIMGLSSSRVNLMAVAAIFLAALTSTEVEACLGEPCNIGNPTMCRLIRETNQADAMPARRRLPANWQVEQNRREKEMLAAKRRTRKSHKRGDSRRGGGNVKTNSSFR